MAPILVPRPRAPVARASETPTFSVTIAAYQAAGYIAEAIESVLDQTCPAHEVIVCDDGSTDDLEAALAPYRRRVVFLRTEHRGMGAARNSAARAATGEFVATLDADDVYLPGYLEAVGDLAMLRPDLDILTTNAYLEVDGRVIGRYYPDVARFVVGDQRRGVLHNYFVFGLASLRRDRLLAIGGYDESLSMGQDVDCFLRMILGGAAAGLVDEPLARYRLREASMSSNRAESMRVEVEILESVGRRASLSSGEREYLERQLRVKRDEVRLAQMEAAVRNGAPDARSRALDVAFGRLQPGFGLRTRLNAIASALAPELGVRMLDLPGARSMMRPETRGR